MTGLVIFVGVSGAMLFLARGASEFTEGLALNLAAEFVGALVILLALTPILRRAQQGSVREHRRLDFDWYTDRVGGADTSARILHTFSRLFMPPFHDRFSRAASSLLLRGGRIQILLMDPDSAAARQRAAELSGHGDVVREIRHNLQELETYRQSLDESNRGRFEVRLYNAAPSVQIYQWDNRLLASFFPLGRLSGDHSQLEVSAESPLGDFVIDRFDELWRQSVSINDYMSLQVMILDPAGDREYRSRFVMVDDIHYLVNHKVIAHLARIRDNVVHATLRRSPEMRYTAEIVDDETELATQISTRFHEKYNQGETAIVQLIPDIKSPSD